MAKRLLIIRHAERPAIAKGNVGNDVSLTEYGLKTTQQFANTLTERIVSIHSSPVLRCMQTAQLIAEVHAYRHSDIEVNRLLGDPGFFIEDADVAWQSWCTKGNDTVNAYLLEGSGTWPGFRDIDNAITDMANHMRQLLSTNDSGLVIWVTHDTILATLVSRLLPQPLTLAEWPNFLGNLEVTLNDNCQLDFTYFQGSL